MGSNSDDAKQGESTRDRIEAFVDAIDDVPSVTAGKRGFGDEFFARVNVDFDYGNREEFGDGKVVVSPQSEDPVGRVAYREGLRIARTQPFPDREETGLWFATEEDLSAGEADE